MRIRKLSLQEKLKVGMQGKVLASELEDLGLALLDK